jgi:hypothetical protein
MLLLVEFGCPTVGVPWGPIFFIAAFPDFIASIAFDKPSTFYHIVKEYNTIQHR